MNENASSEITEHFAQFIIDTDYPILPPEVIAAAKRAVMDYLSIALAGSLEPAAELVTNLIRQTGCTPQATVLGAGFKTSSLEAALANGVMAHALDYDDVSANSSGHPVSMHLTSVILSAALSLGEELRASGTDIITAYAIGYEVASKLTNAMGPDFGDNLGWHPSSVIGIIGASAASAKLLNLRVPQLINAIGIAASHATGLRQNFGTMTKSLHIGNAARSGILSARLARDGFTAAPNALEGRFGFCHAFSGGEGYELSRAVRTIGQPFELILSPPAVKLHPCCASTHGALTALFPLLNKYGIRADNIAAIEVSVPFDPPRSLIYDNPQTGLEGKFSLQYCLAAAVVDSRLRLETFTTKQVQRPWVRRLFDKITMFRQPDMKGHPSWEEPEYTVTIKTSDGEVYSASAGVPFVAPVSIPTSAEMAEKYENCASLVLSSGQIATSLNLLENLESLKDITKLYEIITPEQDKSHE